MGGNRCDRRRQPKTQPTYQTSQLCSRECKFIPAARVCKSIITRGIKRGYVECEARRADALEARRAESGGGGFWGEGSELTPHQLGSLGSAVSSPIPEKFEFGEYRDLKIASKHCSGIKQCVVFYTVDVAMKFYEMVY